MVELWDGGGGLPYLGSPTAYNAGDWEQALRKYHDDGVYEAQIAEVDAWAGKWLDRSGRHGAGRFKFVQKEGDRGLLHHRAAREHARAHRPQPRARGLHELPGARAQAE